LCPPYFYCLGDAIVSASAPCDIDTVLGPSCFDRILNLEVVANLIGFCWDEFVSGTALKSSKAETKHRRDNQDARQLLLHFTKASSAVRFNE
jgi:hypothetical protein